MRYDIVIIGGGILGTTISYWLSSLSNHNVCVIEKENRVAAHASSRNTGVVHSPFYLDPEKKGKIAKAAFQSHGLWKNFAKIHNIPWLDVGTIEIALDDSQHQTLEKYLKWGMTNGLTEYDLKLLTSEEISKKEPNVKCYSGIYCKKDASTDYGMLTEKLQLESKQHGAEFLFKEKISFKQWLCILLGLCGAVLVVSGDHGFGVPSPYSLLIVLAAIAWGLYFNLYKKFALNYDALSMMCYIIWFGTIPLLFYSAHLPNEMLHATWQANMSVILLGIFPSAMAYVLWGYVLKNMPLTIASNFLYCSPIVAMSLAVVFLNEKPSMMVLLGGVIIVGSLVWMNWGNRRTIE